MGLKLKEQTNATNIVTKNESTIDLDMSLAKDLNVNVGGSNKANLELTQTSEKNLKLGKTESVTNGIKDVEVNNSSVVDENGIAKISVPTKLSELTNDENFITNEVDNLINYFTKEDINKKIEGIPTGGTDINIIKAFNFLKIFQENEIYNANAVNDSVDWIIQAILEAFNREVIISINVVINPQTFQIMSIDGSYPEIVNAVDLGGIPRVVCQMAGTNIRVFLNLAMINGTYAFFTTTMKVDLGAGETKYLLGVNISERNQFVIIEPLA
jgi:hypothetical protein